MGSARQLDALELHHILARASATASANATATASEAAKETIAEYATALNGVNQPLNNIFKVSVWWSLGALAMVILLVRLWHRGSMHFRMLVGMALDRDSRQQACFRNHGNGWWWKFKKHVLYAPLGKVRHNNEIKLSSVLSMGCVPSRFHSILLLLLWLSNIGYCLALSYSEENGYAIIAELRGRSGVLAVINMIALVLLAGRNNPLIPLLQISFDTYNLIHRWIGRIVVVESVVHTLCWAFVKHKAVGWSGLFDQLAIDPFAYWGLVGTISMIVIIILSLSPVRHAFYETFLDIHIILAAAAMVGIWLHCQVAGLPQLPYVKTVVILWGLDRFARLFRLIWDNYSRNHGMTQAWVVALPGEACRVTLRLPKKLDIYPGSHAYLRFTTLNWWESHPFSIAWVSHQQTMSSLPIIEKTGLVKVSDKDMITQVSFVIQAQQGMTRHLYNKALECREQGLTITAALEGPYGGHHSLDSYGHAVLFAGASGITHQIPFVKHLVEGCENRTIATRKVTLVWVVRDSETFEWVRPWMEQILKMPGRRECLTIKLFVTRPKNSRDVQSPSKTVQIMSGRPNFNVVLGEEVKAQCGAMCVTVCGPGAMQDGVRAAVRGFQANGVIDYIEESFTW